MVNWWTVLKRTYNLIKLTYNAHKVNLSQSNLNVLVVQKQRQRIKRATSQINLQART